MSEGDAQLVAQPFLTMIPIRADAVECVCDPLSTLCLCMCSLFARFPLFCATLSRAHAVSAEGGVGEGDGERWEGGGQGGGGSRKGGGGGGGDEGGRRWGEGVAWGWLGRETGEVGAPLPGTRIDLSLPTTGNSKNNVFLVAESGASCKRAFVMSVPLDV